MKRIKSLLVIVALLLGGATARAQYYEIANQVQNMLGKALSGSFNYKGFVDVSALGGTGDKKVNFFGVSTTQGFKYASWFYMGVGLGVDVATAKNGAVRTADGRPYDGNTTKAMIPVFSDFRFNIGGTGTNVFIDIKAGATWLVGNGDLVVDDIAMTHGTQFYLRPSLGVRIPVSTDTRRVLNIGVTYQLITSDNFYNYNNNSLSLNAFGATISYEW